MFSLSDKQREVLLEMLSQGRKLEAIKYYRDISGCYLKEAKESIDALESAFQDEQPEHFAKADTEEKTTVQTNAPKTKGNLRVVLLALFIAAIILWFIAR